MAHDLGPSPMPDLPSQRKRPSPRSLSPHNGQGNRIEVPLMVTNHVASPGPSQLPLFLGRVKPQHVPATAATKQTPQARRTRVSRRRRRRRGRRRVVVVVVVDVSQVLPGKHFHDAVAAAADDPAAVMTPDHRAHALAPHNPVGGHLLRAAAFLEGPEPEGGVVAG